MDKKSLKIKLNNNEFALIDTEDFALISQYNWFVNPGVRTKYAIKNKSKKLNGCQFRLMHRLILSTKDPKILIDHINGNGLDNRKSNLRIATSSQQQMNVKLRLDNTSGIKGVHFNKARQKYDAYIHFKGKKLNLGRFKTLEEAEKARKRKSAELFKNFDCY